MSNSEKFDKLFKEFDQETQKKAKQKRIKFDCTYDKKNGYIGLKSCVDNLYNLRYNPYFENYDFIDFCLKIRNIKFHSNDDIYFYLTDETIKKFEKILEEVKHPYTLNSKSVKGVYDAMLSSNVKKVMKEMNDKCYTHIPIYDDLNGNLVGIFSEYSLYDFLLKNEFMVIDEDTTFDQIRECINLENLNGRVIFESKNSLYDDVVKRFIEEYKNKSKLECIMVTNSGKKSERVIGILTIWDVIGS